ncbi:ATP synthase F1 subunit epsilon [Cyclobacterium marinum]|uniref:ATPase, F1 complex, delta/epsilon subunit n=1 Tax=Cyclobacterium marinum (strain ATCC 25205 / DSM 745 / LMG 13164 / NCIMB 1802) TaxID=880070 RepID=G0J167_CYCMS|nr:ATP synthase F1 subunit epsilon [Cyclobacterium marinum]AEL25816.1 ATPase, F1 complex, delta/epsilon subunit [Cyclobacterium marinum DSM 745]MBI0401245.1 ATP synthase F1 subunit epsilon [Cyclobacterium marinum]|tara:strand:+ start:64449 stop:64694 length:246 start_codon:yes stop_codon:yes gene_type:complete
MHLEIITPDQKVFEGEVSEATFPGADGSFQVLKNHAAIISALEKGAVSYTTAEGQKSLVVDGGVVEVNDNKIIVLAEKVVD